MLARRLRAQLIRWRTVFHNKDLLSHLGAVSQVRSTCPYAWRRSVDLFSVYDSALALSSRYFADLEVPSAFEQVKIPPVETTEIDSGIAWRFNFVKPSSLWRCVWKNIY